MNNPAPPNPSSSRVSIVIPAYNHARFLGEAIESTLSQTVLPSEIIVIDDGSTDRPESVAGRYPEVRLIRQTNQGLAAARNSGIRASSSEYVVFLDADDRLMPKALEVNLAQFAAHPECGFVYGAHCLIDATGQIRTPLPLRPIGEDPFATMLAQNAVGMHATVLYRRELLEAMGGFDKNYPFCEDYDLYLRLSYRYPVVCTDQCLAEYRRHGGNVTRNAPLILRGALGALRRQKPVARTRPDWYAAYKRGMFEWKRHYANELIRNLALEEPTPHGAIRHVMEMIWLAPLETRRAYLQLRREQREMVR